MILNVCDATGVVLNKLVTPENLIEVSFSHTSRTDTLSKKKNALHGIQGTNNLPRFPVVLWGIRYS